MRNLGYWLAIMVLGMFIAGAGAIGGCLITNGNSLKYNGGKGEIAMQIGAAVGFACTVMLGYLLRPRRS